MIVKLNSLDDLRRWWPMFKTAMTQLDPKCISVDPITVEQHVLNILSIPYEGWVGLNLDEETITGFIIMKRKLSLLPTAPEYESLLTYFAPSKRIALEELFLAFEKWASSAEASSYEIHTNHTQIYYRMPIPYKKHSVTLKREF